MSVFHSLFDTCKKFKKKTAQFFLQKNDLSSFYIVVIALKNRVLLYLTSRILLYLQELMAITWCDAWPGLNEWWFICSQLSNQMSVCSPAALSGRNNECTGLCRHLLLIWYTSQFLYCIKIAFTIYLFSCFKVLN